MLSEVRATVGLATLFGLVATSAVLAITATRVLRDERRQNRPIVSTTDRRNGIVVFGAKVRPAGPCHELRARLDHAHGLWAQQAAPLLIVSGGIDDGVDEVTAMSDYLIGLGTPADAIVSARPGDNTRLTLQAVGRLAPGRYFAVSSPYHAYRINREARRQGLDVVANCPATTPDTQRPRVHRVRRVAEVLGVVLYALPAPLASRLREAVGRRRHSVPGALTGTST